MEAGLKALPKHVAARLQVLMGVTSNLQVWGSVEKRGRGLAGAEQRQLQVLMCVTSNLQVWGSVEKCGKVCVGG